MVNIRQLTHTLRFLLVILCFCGSVVADGSLVLELPKPRTTGGRPLMEVLADRRSSRQFSRKEIPLQVLSDMLWAAWGVNRPESGKRTAPSAVNWQEIDIYVATANGLYRYDAFRHVLVHVSADDVREATGTQEFVKEAPVNLVFVADYSRMGRASQKDKDFYSAADAGFISQNVYLYCASVGLATVVRGALDRVELARKMKLGLGQKIILAQTVGYPID
ncbi:MAG: SagB/ThcOx family dehydrogenase [candidate division WOR-3 bacterium]|nr:MAG: SagB/ThcOx family dehydrogenase [candidate division WOR-3 bacterium]